MIDLHALMLSSTGPVTGDFRLSDPSLHETRAGRRYLRFQLEDCTGSIPAYVWNENLYRNFDIQNFGLVRICGQSRIYNGQFLVDLHSFHPIHQKRAGDVIRLIPLTLCPLPILLPKLQAAVNRIKIPALKTFVESVLAEDAIAFSFVSVPGSLNHHHHYPGGLLNHSLECVAMAERFCEFPKESYEIGMVAALFHDIGKILTLTPGMQLTSLGSSLDHDKLTLEVLAPYFKQLDRDWPEGATELRCALTWKLRKPVPRYNVADMVACCDRLSAGLDRHKRA